MKTNARKDRSNKQQKDDMSRVQASLYFYLFFFLLELFPLFNNEPRLDMIKENKQKRRNKTPWTQTAN
jgi:hypothetical protein